MEEGREWTETAKGKKCRRDEGKMEVSSLLAIRHSHGEGRY